MSRQLKFRAWDKDYKEMLDNIIIYQGEVYKNTMPVAVSPLNAELMQYTGLKDKNGKEIYEGDVVKYKFAFYRDISKVEFNQDIAAFDMVSIKELDDNSSMRAFKKGSRRGFNKNLVAGFDYVEVIGNIYENPELLVKT